MSVDEIVIDIVVDPEFELESTSTVVDVDAVEPILSVITVEGPPGPPGPPGTQSPVFNETPTGGIDGVNTIFTLAHAYQPGTVRVFLNGLHETHYGETTSTTITFDEPPLPDDDITLDYLIA